LIIIEGLIEVMEEGIQFVMDLVSNCRRKKRLEGFVLEGLVLEAFGVRWIRITGVLMDLWARRKLGVPSVPSDKGSSENLSIIYQW
jgi:hypothetical protein